MSDRGWWLSLRYPRYFENLQITPKTIFLESEHGKVFNGIIFQMALHLATHPDYQAYTIIVSALKDKIPDFQAKLSAYGVQRVQFCAYRSDAYYRALATSNYLINDTSFISCFIKKKGQVYLNTWHGTPLKTLGKSVVDQQHLIGNIQRNFLAADYLLVPNKFTDRVLREDYMLDHLARGKRLFGGYPRNTAFFSSAERVATLRSKLGSTYQHIYAYLPTYRGNSTVGKTEESDASLWHHLVELDRRLHNDELLLVNLHPLARSEVDFQSFQHIRPFPMQVETYDVLAAADCLITDYSSVFFDFACSRKKVILFTYDKEEYLRDRGLYFPMEDLPFPQVKRVEALLTECRTSKNYDDTVFLQTYCPYDGAEATEKLCAHVILGKQCLHEEAFPKNGKENVLIYAGNLAQNGITAACFSLLRSIDLNRRNYILLVDATKVKPFASQLARLPQGVTYLVHHGQMNATFYELLWRFVFKVGLVNVKAFLARFKKRFEQNTIRILATSTIDTVIQYNGYEDEILLWLSTFKCKRIVYAHSDMCKEIKVRKNARRDVLEYVYATYDRIVAVTQDILPSTKQLAPTKAQIDVVRNFICYKDVLDKMKLTPQLDEDSVSTHTLEQINEILQDKTLKKIITMGRYAPEKGHLRLLDAFKRVLNEEPMARLFIIGGNSYYNWHQKTLNYVKTLGLQDKVILMLKVSNPFPFVKACDGFVLSSFYEGFGLVLAEANILGLPILSTDIIGPRLFMQTYGGCLVENSEVGLYQGMCQLLKGEVARLKIDYDAYNCENVVAFERLFEVSQSA